LTKWQQKRQRVLKNWLEDEWHVYPHYVRTFESETLDELMARLTKECGNVLLATRRYKYVARIVNAIDAVYARLPRQAKQLVQVRYWNSPNILKMKDTASRLGMSAMHAAKINRSIMHAIADVLGCIWLGK
jgi:hypothetical protein